MEQRQLGLRIQVRGDFETVVRYVKDALREQGFGTLTEIDVQATIREKLGTEFYDYVILGACNPPLAHQALTADPEVGLLLPCNAIVYRSGEECTVEVMDPRAMADIAGIPGLAPVASEAYERLRAALERLEGGDAAP